MNKFIVWLRALTEVQKSRARRPDGMSRRGFLRALGVTAVTVAGGGLLAAKTDFVKIGFVFDPKANPLDGNMLRAFIASTLDDLGRPNFVEIARDLKNIQATRALHYSERSASEGVMQFNVFEAVKPVVSPNYDRKRLVIHG